jgi:peptidoglycan/LPS O-acetylase OafA/YrhL
MDKKTARLGWLDAAKGLGIILVVIGHVWTRGPVRDAIYAFHMPLFFIAAGYIPPSPRRWAHSRRSSGGRSASPMSRFSSACWPQTR